MLNNFLIKKWTLKYFYYSNFAKIPNAPNHQSYSSLQIKDYCKYLYKLIVWKCFHDKQNYVKPYSWPIYSQQYVFVLRLYLMNLYSLLKCPEKV